MLGIAGVGIGYETPKTFRSGHHRGPEQLDAFIQEKLCEPESGSGRPLIGEV